MHLLSIYILYELLINGNKKILIRNKQKKKKNLNSILQMTKVLVI